MFQISKTCLLSFVVGRLCPPGKYLLNHMCQDLYIVNKSYLSEISSVETHGYVYIILLNVYSLHRYSRSRFWITTVTECSGFIKKVQNNYNDYLHRNNCKYSLYTKHLLRYCKIINIFNLILLIMSVSECLCPRFLFDYCYLHKILVDTIQIVTLFSNCSFVFLYLSQFTKIMLNKMIEFVIFLKPTQMI